MIACILLNAANPSDLVAISVKLSISSAYTFCAFSIVSVRCDAFCLGEALLSYGTKTEYRQYQRQTLSECFLNDLDAHCGPVIYME